MNVSQEHPGANEPVSPELLGRLLDQQAAVLTLYARQWCRCPDDVVQEALVELARQKSAPSDVVSWLYRVVRNKAISAARSAGRRRHHETRAAAQESSWFSASLSDPIDARAAAAELEALPLEQREVVIAHLWGGRTFSQIGQLTGVSDSTAQRRYVAAIAALSARLNKTPLEARPP